jgi:tetratricopeptide (TPR) repeat protein
LVNLPGQIFYDEGDFNSALYFLLLNYETDRNKLKSLLLLGKTFEKMDDQRKAIITYNKLNSLYPEETIGMYQIGKLFFKKGDLDIAHENFARIITIDPLHFKSHVYLALILRVDKIDQKRLEEILGHLHQAKEEAGDNRKFKVLIHQNFAELYQEQGNIDLALKYYSTVRSLQPNQTDVLLHLADLQLKKKRFVTSLNLYLEAHKLDPRLLFPLHQIANLYSFLSKYDRAVHFFELILQEEPDNVPIILTLGRVIRDKMNRPAASLPIFQKGFQSEFSQLILFEVASSARSHQPHARQ